MAANSIKSVQIRSFFWSEYSKIRTRKNSVFGHFSRSGNYRSFQVAVGPFLDTDAEAKFLAKKFHLPQERAEYVALQI